MATGLVDTKPEIDGLDDAVERGLIRYCPVCDAFETTDRRIAPYWAPAGLRLARPSSCAIIPKTSRSSGVGRKPSDAAGPRKAGIVLEPHTTSLKIRGQKVCAVSSGTPKDFDVLYPALGCKVQSDLAVSLGAATNDVGCLKVDEHQRTTVDGIYAAGDAVSDCIKLPSQPAMPATHIHKSP